MMSSLHANLSPRGAAKCHVAGGVARRRASPYRPENAGETLLPHVAGEAPHWTISVCACGKGAGELGLVHDAPSFKATRQPRLVRCTKSLRASVRFSAQPSSTNGNRT